MLIRFSDTVGFNFNGDSLCLGCTKDIAEGTVIELGASPIPDADVHELISVWAARASIPAYAVTETWTYDTESYDSGDLPKPFESTAENERCDNCGSYIAPWN